MNNLIDNISLQSRGQIYLYLWFEELGIGDKLNARIDLEIDVSHKVSEVFKSYLILEDKDHSHGKCGKGSKRRPFKYSVSRGDLLISRIYDLLFLVLLGVVIRNEGLGRFRIVLLFKRNKPSVPK